MKKYLQKKLKDQKGMTLIELLAVIVIIAIIAAIAIPAIGNIIENSRFGAAKSDIQGAFSAANLYEAEEDEAPATVADIIPTYLEDSGTLLPASTFDDSGDALKIAGSVKVNDVTYEFDAITNAALSELSSQEFKELLNAE